MGVFERHRYPPNWEELAWACKELAGWKCKECGAKDGDVKIGTVKGREYTIVIAACHLDHDPENPNPRLIALCQACHLRLDGMQHGKTRKRRRHERIRSEQVLAGQLTMWEDKGA